MKNTNSRNLGLEVIKEVPWGTHLCQFYKTKEDLLDILVPYFKAGLENNEFCMWVTSEPLSVEEAERELKKIVKDLDDYINKGQLEILDYSEWYTTNGKFDSGRVLEGWVEKEKYALQNGFDGLRLTGNMFWLGKNDWDDFKSYEETVNDVIDKHRMIAICSYSLEKCNASEIIDVVSNHQFTIIKRKSKWNIIENSERKKIKEILNEKTIFYETLVNTSPEAITVTDLEGRITYLSNKTLKLLGYNSTEELLGHNAFEFIASEDHEKAKIALQQTFVDSGIRNFECTAVRKDGTRIILEESTVIIKDSMGNPKSFMAIAREITDRKKVEEALRESKRELNVTLNATTSGIYKWNFKTNVLFFDPRYYTMLGYEPGAFPATYETWKSLIHPDDLAGALSVAEDYLVSKPDHYENEFRMRTKAGEYRWIHAQSTVVERDECGKAVQIIGNHKDITERKKAEAELKYPKS